MTSLSLQEIPEGDRPRERLLSQGGSALTTAELLAVLLRTGTPGENVLRLAERLLAHFGGLHGLARASQEEIGAFHGLGRAKIAQVMAAIEIGTRLATMQQEDRPTIREAADAARLVIDMQYLAQEHIRVILLDSNRRVIAMPTVYIGTVNSAVLRAAEIFREAIIRNAPALILAHNHPSGDPSPSPEDVKLTNTLIEAGRLLDITLLDHIILGGGSWRSLRELGLTF
jgi:DNA repair protein RadC